MTSSSLLPLLAFAAVVALIPLVLWLVKRSGYGGAAQDGLMRVVSSLALSPSQKVIVVELGHGVTARWLVLGVSGDRITTLTEMQPPADVPSLLRSPQAATVTQLIDKWRSKARPGGETRP